MELENMLVAAIFRACPDAKYASAQSELVCRCPYCGDSRKSHHGHLYIKVKLHEGESPVFYCHRCQVKGVANSEFLRNLGIFDIELSGTLTKYNRIVASNPANRYKFLEKAELLNPIATQIDQSYTKLEYISNRIGVQLNFQELLKLKICLNLFDLLDINEITNLSVSKGMASGLDADFIGFVSVDNKYIISRNVGTWFDGRYFKYNIFGSYDNTKSFYSIPNRIDMMATAPVEINIAEGPFDIVSVFYNLKNQNLDNTLYIANCGSGFLGTIRYFIKYGFVDCKINIYSDGDKDIGFYKYIKNQLKDMLVDEFDIYYNVYPGEKDFGVPLNRIEMVRTTI